MPARTSTEDCSAGGPKRQASRKALTSGASMRPILLVVVFSCLWVMWATPFALAAPTDQPVHVGRLLCRFNGGGLYLSVDGVPLLKGGVVQAFYGDVRQDDYGSGGKPPTAVQIALPDGGVSYSAEFVDRGAAGSFIAKQTVEVHPDGLVRFLLTANWNGIRPAELEWNPVRLWTYPFVGARCDVQTDSGSSEQTRITRISEVSGYPANRICAPWRDLSITAPGFAHLAFINSNPGGLIAFDARNDPYIAALKVIWIGETGVEIRQGETCARSLDLQVTPDHPAVALASGAPQVAANPVNADTRIMHIPSPAAYREDDEAAGEDKVSIVPRPKAASFTGESFPMPSRLQFNLDCAAWISLELRAACLELGEDLAQEAHCRTSVSPWSSKKEGNVLLSVDSSTMNHSEGYRLVVNKRGIRIVGADVKGAFYGLQTLRQMLLPDSNRRHGRYHFVGAEIQDWPTLAFRGAHIFVGKDALTCHTELIRKVLSRFKLNALVIECEYTKWKSHPELWRDISMDPDDLRRVVQEAKAHFVEPIPLINTLGHSEWIFKNGVHIDLAEDVNSPHNYDPSNPETYRLVFDVFTEAISIFDHPRYFHIGHDEVKVPSYDSVGRYPARPNNIARGAGALFLVDVDRLSAWLHAHGATPMLWGDMLLNRTEGKPDSGNREMNAAFAPTVAEARQRRASIPTDAIVCDWRYEPGSERRNGLSIFLDSGHAAIGSAWFQPRNIQGWAAQADRAGALGTLQTTWAGYDIGEPVLETEFRQFSAYVLAAEEAWNGGSVPIASMNYDVQELFRTNYRRWPDPDGTKGWTVDFGRAANIDLFGQSEEGVPWSAYPAYDDGNRADTAVLQAPPPPFGKHDYSLGGIALLGEHPGGIMLRGAASPTRLPIGFGSEVDVTYPEAVRISIERRAREIDFLQATGYSADEGDEVARYRVYYSDGSQVDIPIRYGYETRALDDGGVTGLSTFPAPLRGVASGGGQFLTLRRFRWRNPYPTRRVANIELLRTHAFAAPIVFGITGYEYYRNTGQS